MENQDIQNKATEPDVKATKLSIPSQFRTLKKTHISIIVLTIITALLLIFSLFFTKAATTPKANPPEYVRTILKLTTPKVASPSSYQSEIKISTNQNKIMAIGLRISFDPKVLANVDIKTGSFFSSPLILAKNINMAKGVIAYDLVLTPKQMPVKGNGIVAIISFSVPRAKGSTSLNFLSTTKVMDQGYNISVLKTATGITFAIK